jgi:hypothetical protein
MIGRIATEAATMEMATKLAAMDGAHVGRSHSFRSAASAADQRIPDYLAAVTMATPHEHSTRTTVDIDIKIQVERWETPEIPGVCSGKSVGGRACDHEGADQG